MHLLARGPKKSRGVAKAYASFLRGALAQLTDAVRRGQQEGNVRGDLPPEMLALWLLAAALGFSTILQFGITADFNEVRSATLKFFEKERSADDAQD